MPPRGPKPEPQAVKDQKAPVRSPHQAPPVYHQAVAATVVAVAPPKWLKGDGRQIWNRLSPGLRVAKLLTSSDAETFGRYCRNFARWLKMQKTLDNEGETYETETYGGDDKAGGKLKRAHPAFLISDRLERQLLAAEDRFGLNPSERQRIFAARAQTGATGDLFGTPDSKRSGDPASMPAQPSQPEDGPIGFLN